MSNIAVYAKGTTDFFNQGMGVLSDIISSDTTQMVSSSGNVKSELELSYPVGGYLSERLIEGNFIRVSMAIDSSKYAIFEIIDSIKDDSGTLTIYGAPYSDRIGRMSFDNGGTFGTYSSVQSALNFAKSNIKGFPSWFQLTSNISKSVDFTKDGIIKDFATFLDLLNQKVSGNIYYDLNIIQIYSALGKDRTDITLRDDRNTNSVKVKTDYSSIINRVIPVLPVLDKDGNATQETKLGTIVNSKTPNQFLDYWAGLAVKLDTQDLANTYFDRTHADRPVQTVDVDPIGMDEDFSDINIFDRVQLYSTKLKYTDKLRVIKRVIDNLTGMVTSFSLGSSSVTLTNQIQQVQNDVTNQIKAITTVMVSASGKNQTYISNIKPTSANEGDMWIQEDGDYKAFWIYKDGDWIKLVDSDTEKDIADSVAAALEKAKIHVEEVKQVLSTDIATARSEAVSQANTAASQAYDYTDAVKQGLSGDIETAKSQAEAAANAAITQANTYTATAIEQNNASQQEMMDDIAKSQADLAIKDADFINKAQDMADKALSDAKANTAMVASKSLGTYLVRLLPGTNIFKTTNSTTIQAQVWKAGQDITSTLDNASFSWKLAKDGANAIGLTNNVKNITAKPSDFTNTGTYIVNVIIPVTDTTGTTRNQTFSDSTTIANLADGKNGDTGNGISSTTITYAVSASGTNAPTSGYTSTIPTVNKGQFLWQRTTTSYTNGITKNSDVVTYFAKDGLNGVPGMDGGQGMIAQPSKPTSGLVDGFLWLDTSQTYPVYYIYDSSIKDFKIYQFNAKNINADQIKAKFVGTDRLSASQIIADDLRVKSANIDGRLTASQITVSSTDGSQTSLADFNLGEMSQTISDAKNAVNNLGQVNQLMNTEFTPDLQGWTLSADKGSNAPYASYVAYGSRGIGFYTVNADANTYASLSQTVQLPSTRLETDVMSLSWRVNTRIMDNYCHIWLVWQDANGVSLGQNTMGNWNDSTLNKYNVLKWENISIPIDAKQVRVSFETREGTNAYIFQPMVSFTDTIGAYVQGNYNNNAALAQVKITADGVSSIVSNPTTGLATRVQTAEGSLSKVQGIDIPALQNATFWQPYSSLNFNDYTKQGSFFFNTTAGKTNGPTTSNSWTYLIVEQGTSAKDRIKQTAWYDGVTGAKITYVRTLNSGTWSPWYANDNDSVTTITQTNGNVTREIENRKTGDNNTLQSSKDFTQSTLTSYDSGLQSQLTQTSSAFLATISSTNLVIDSSLTDSAFSGSIVNWIPSGTSKWYYSPGVSYQGVQSMGYNQSSLNGDYSFVDSQSWGINSFSGSTLNVSVDVIASNMGGTSTDYLIVILMEQDNNGNQTQRTDITGTISKTNNSWVNYRKKITIDPLSRTFFLRYQMRGNGNVYVARPYVGVQELIPGGYTAGTNNNNQTILSLFKDNWSIGITDNIGKITSGIVGNSSSMSLISKNIVLDGNTTFTALKKTVGDTDNAVSQVKNTADSISNFVRDSSGNLSSNFQTALGKTSIITGTTLASSIKVQTATQISSALTDNNGKIISLINQDSSGVQIAGENIALDGNTTFTALKRTINSMGQVNQLMNTEFTPDLQGWDNELDSYTISSDESTFSGSRVIEAKITYESSYIDLKQKVPVTPGTSVSFSVYRKMIKTTGVGSGGRVWVSFVDSSNNEISGYNIPYVKSQDWKYENLTNMIAPANATFVLIDIYINGAGIYRLSKPMLVFDSTVGSYVQGNYNNNGALSQVKNTADGISNFVRDPSGNLSYEFQTALGKTSIVTGSKLATSIQEQTASQITSALTDNNGKIISLINQDSSGVQIAGENIILDGTVKALSTFWASQINAVKVDASNITTGILDAAKARIINVDASSISAGNLNVGIKINANSITTGSLDAKLLIGDTAHLQSVDTGNIVNRYDYHLQISAYGLYNGNTQVGQLNFHSYKGGGGDWDDTYTGSITYHFETSSSGQNTGLRFWRNHIMSLNKDQNTALYLNPYAGSQVRVTSRTNDNTYYAINASAFNVASDRRFKSDIKDYEEDALEIIKSLRIRKYKKSGKREIGIIADEANDELLLKDKNGDFLSLYDYISIAVKAIQEQNAIIEDLIEKSKEDKTE